MPATEHICSAEHTSQARHARLSSTALTGIVLRIGLAT